MAATPVSAEMATEMPTEMPTKMHPSIAAQAAVVTPTTVVVQAVVVA